MSTAPRVLVIACGALAREIGALRAANGWLHLDVRCLPPELHNRPERIPGAVRDAAFVAALIDAWWPAALVRTSPRPLATIAYTLDLLADPAVIDDTPVLYRGTVPVAADGYFVETRELWTADGRLLALNHQTFRASIRLRKTRLFS